MEFTNDGLTLWYGTPDAPAPPDEVDPDFIVLTVGARPASLNNGVNVTYSVDGSPARYLRASLLERGESDGNQYFQAEFPYVAPGSWVRYAPTLVCAGRSVSAGTDSNFPSSFHVSAAKPERRVAAAPRTDGFLSPRFGRSLEFIARASIPVEKKLEVIGVTPDGLHIDFYVTGGTLVGPRINARFRHHGGDWMKIRSDGIGIADIRATLETDRGELILAEYSGVLDLGDDGYKNAIAGSFPPSPPAVVTPRFLTGVPELMWLCRLQCVGIGFLDTIAEQLNYDLFAVHPERSKG